MAVVLSFYTRLGKQIIISMKLGQRSELSDDTQLEVERSTAIVLCDPGLVNVARSRLGPMSSSFSIRQLLVSLAQGFIVRYLSSASCVVAIGIRRCRSIQTFTRIAVMARLPPPFISPHIRMSPHPATTYPNHPLFSPASFSITSNNPFPNLSNCSKATSNPFPPP